MTSKTNKENIPDVKSDAEGAEVYHFEAVRKCSAELEKNTINTSCENYASLHDSDKDENKTPPYASIMVTDNSANTSSSSTQTEASLLEAENCYADMNLSFDKDFKQESTSNENSEHSLGNKRFRRDSHETDNRVLRPWKKTKCDSSASSTSDVTTEPKQSLGPSVSSSHLSSTSETSFKSIDSTPSYKIKRRPKSDTSLFRDAVQQSRKRSNLGKHNYYSENNTPGGSGTPRRERSHRKSTRTKAWRLMDICTWIGKKGYQSISGLYTDLLREPTEHNPGGISLMEEVKEMRSQINIVNKKQERLKQENDVLREEMTKMMTRIDDLEGMLRCQERHRQFHVEVPPPPPPPPPPPLPAQTKSLTSSITTPRCGLATSRSNGPRMSITEADIASVKLRKTKDNPVRSKPLPNGHQPLVTQQMLQTMRSKLGRARSMASSTPKEQLSELEKCLMQESMVSSLFRRRVTVGSSRSAEELRSRPYPATRGPRSPRSPRSNSLPRRTPLSPLKLSNCVVTN